MFPLATQISDAVRKHFDCVVHRVSVIKSLRETFPAGMHDSRTQGSSNSPSLRMVTFTVIVLLSENSFRISPPTMAFLVGNTT